MAGDWIKMRVSLAKDPAVIAMADHLAEQRAFMDWLTDPVRCHCKESAYEHVTRNVTVAVTVSALLVFWGVANEVGKPDGDDLVLRHATLESVDESSGVPGFGDAMAYVDWAIAEEQDGRYQLRLPKFLINNVPAEDRSKKGNAERQRRFREKHALEGNDKSNVTDNVTVTHREEKRREEKKDQKHLSVSATPKADVPAEAILAAFRELLPDFPQPRKLDGDRKKKIIARWHEDPERQTLDWWRDYFGYVAKSDFLTGRTGWTGCGFDWLIAPKNMRKVVEGNYENRGEA